MSGTRRSSGRSGAERRVWWSEEENRSLLELIGAMRVVRALVRKRQKNADIFKAVEKEMRQRGSRKTWQQIRSRWKRMKSEYIKEKRVRSRRLLRNSTSTNDFFFQEMSRVLGRWADSIETPDETTAMADTEQQSQEYSENGADEVKVHVELIEGDAVLEHSMSVCEEADVEEIKAEPPTSPSSSESIDDKITADNDSSTKKKKKSNANRLKTFADEYARKHNLYIREWQDQYQDWFERQMESQQQWEETFMREQMELAKSMLESVTTTFLQGMQQVIQNVMGSIGRRPMTPFCPTLPRNLDLNGLNHADMSSFMDPQSATTNNRAFMPTNSKMDEAADL